jgi:NTP pyrophosphatase (non-canonical NTP hydrolase)
MLKNKLPKLQFRDFDEYQKFCNKHAIYPAIGKKFIYALIGLSEEVGEISGKIKKVYRDEGGKITKLKKVEIVKEIGDAMFYVAQLCTDLNIKLSDIVSNNMEKLHIGKKNKKFMVAAIIDESIKI